jgi:Flp pilus assembly protein TadD
MQPSDAYNLGAAYLEAKELDKALVAFAEAIRRDPKYAEAYNGRGVTLALKGEVQRAILDFSEAIRLEPDNPEFYRSRGYVYEQMGEQSQADADLAKAEELEAHP